jgi:hypothetical protein
MKHAGPETLGRIDAMLRELRARDDLVEKTPGSFYFRSSAFLHFHEDPAGIFADLKEDFRAWSRYRVSTRYEQRKLLSRVASCLKQHAAQSNKI